jgi:hypothetical protein
VEESVVDGPVKLQQELALYQVHSLLSILDGLTPGKRQSAKAAAIKQETMMMVFIA